MTERPKSPVVVRRRPPAEAQPKESPEPSGTKAIPTPARGITREPLDVPRGAVARGAGRAFFAPNAIPAPRETNPTPSRPIMRDAPIVAANVRTFGAVRPERGRADRSEDRKRLRSERGPKEVKPPTPPKPRPPPEVFPIDELSIKLLRAVVDATTRNAELPQAGTDPEFVPGATYRDLRRALSLTWPDTRDAVQRLRPHHLLRVVRFFGRFGPVFVISEYGASVLAAGEAGQPLPEPSPALQASLEAARVARAAWDEAAG